jgi:hypothetical protein
MTLPADYAARTVAGVVNLLREAVIDPLPQRFARRAHLGVGFVAADRVHQALRTLARADDFGFVFLGEVAGDPGTDSIDFRHIRKVDFRDRAFDGVDPVLDIGDGGYEIGSGEGQDTIVDREFGRALHIPAPMRAFARFAKGFGVCAPSRYASGRRRVPDCPGLWWPCFASRAGRWRPCVASRAGRWRPCVASRAGRWQRLRP